MDTKEFWKSRRFWGLLITAVSVFAPKYAPVVVGLEQPVAAIAGEVGTVVGLVTSAIGSWKAEKPLSLTKSSTQPPSD